MTATAKRRDPLEYAEYCNLARHALEHRATVGPLQQAIARWADDHIAECGREELAVAMQQLDAERIAEIASGPVLVAFAKELREDADGRARAIDDERRAILAALESSDAQILAAFRWWKEDWKNCFREAAAMKVAS